MSLARENLNGIDVNLRTKQIKSNRQVKSVTADTKRCDKAGNRLGQMRLRNPGHQLGVTDGAALAKQEISGTSFRTRQKISA